MSIPQDDRFEATRIEDSKGLCIFEAQTLFDVIHNNWDHTNGSAGYAFLWFSLVRGDRKHLNVDEGGYSVCVELLLPADVLPKVKALSRKCNELSTEENKIDRYLFGLLAWPPRHVQSEEYFGRLPDTLLGLLSFGERLSIPLTEALTSYGLKDLQLLGGVPVILAIQRPRPIIGIESHVELLSVVINAGGEYAATNDGWNLNSPVYPLSHRTPLTVRLACDISSTPHVNNDRIILIGCGVVGSKMALHMARRGQVNLTLVDYDDLSPHNLVRHALLHQSIGANKAQGIKDEIESIFAADKANVQIEALTCSALDLLPDAVSLFANHSFLIDATASPTVLNALVHHDLPAGLRCCRCEIADEGRLGFLSIEGQNRNPRLDDLQAIIYDRAIECDAVSRWLQSHREQRERLTGPALEEINIGISCSSATMRLADDVASWHAASFSLGLRHLMGEGKNYPGGCVRIADNNPDGGSSSVYPIDAAPVVILVARNRPDWQVRLRNGLPEYLHRRLKHAKPNETGGLLVGFMHLKRRTIYVTRVFDAPPDSQCSPYAFVRGVKDVPESISYVEQRTGNLLGYVGEWHPHPQGGPDLSGTDMEAVRQIRSHLDSVPLPTHILVVTPRGLYPHVFCPA